METKPDTYALQSRCELQALKTLVEVIVTALPEPAQGNALAAFAGGAESTISAMLAFAQRDESVYAMQAAMKAQIERLERRGLQVPRVQLE